MTLQIILGHFAGIKTPIFSISLGFLPLAATATLFGAVQAALSAAAADVISFLLFPTGIFFPGFTLSAAMTGIIYGQAFYKKRVKLWQSSSMLNGQYFYQFTFKYILAVSTYRKSNNSAAASQDTAKYDNAAAENLHDLDVI